MEDRLKAFFDSLGGKKILFLGVGVSNLPLIGKFAALGAKIIACDKKTKDGFDEKTLETLYNAGVELRFGEDYLKDLGANLIVRSPGIRPDLPEILNAVNDGAVLTSEIELLFDFCPSKIIAVTGSDGKTTTATLICEILKKSGYSCRLGGNIGTPLFAEIESIKKGDVAIVELSSFQLMGMKKSPDVAVVTNVAPNHLDWHVSMEEYANAKKNIFLHQKAGARCVLNFDNEATRAFSREAPSEVIFFSRKEKVATGAFCSDGRIFAAHGGDIAYIMDESDILLPGKHNVENYLAAISAVWGMAGAKEIHEVAQTFGGVEHRIEFVRESGGVKYYNDSIASSPTRAKAGLLAFDQKIILIAGGYDKQIPFDEFGEVLCERVKALVLIGKTAGAIERAVKNAKKYPGCGIKIVRAGSLLEAVELSRNAAEPGDVVMLSPGCASFDMFKNFAERGEEFKRIVRALEGDE